MAVEKVIWNFGEGIEKPDGILLGKIFEQTAHLGMVHPTFEPVSTA
jgi:hypothetical protein